MRAMAIDGFGDPGKKLKATELPRPRPGRGEVLIRVVAAGVNPVDWKICRGVLREMFPHRFPLVPGWDVAGVVEEFGEGAAQRLRKGDRVWAYARKPTVQWGCYAEYVTLPEANVGLMPSKLLFEEAAAVPLAALTAWQCLFSLRALEPGSTVLVHAAAGGVGHFAVQLAKRAGATVFGTCGTDKQAFVLSLGADAVIDHANQSVGDVVRTRRPDGVDVVLDCVGGEVLEASYDLVKRGGHLVSIVDNPDSGVARERAFRADFVFVEPSVEQLDILAKQVDRGELKPHVDKIHQLADAAEALATSEQGHVKGKLVLAL